MFKDKMLQTIWTGQVKWTITKWPVQTPNSTKHSEQQDVLDIKDFVWVCVFGIKKMLSYRLGTVNDFH